MASSSSTSCRSSDAAPSRRCASRSRTARSGSSGPATRSSSRAASSCRGGEPVPVRAWRRLGLVHLRSERDPRLRGEADRGPGRPDRHLARGRAARPGLFHRPLARPRRRSSTGSWPRASVSASGPATIARTPSWRRRRSGSTPRSSACWPRREPAGSLSGRGRGRVIRLARTFADLGGRAEVIGRRRRGGALAAPPRGRARDERRRLRPSGPVDDRPSLARLSGLPAQPRRGRAPGPARGRRPGGGRAARPQRDGDDRRRPSGELLRDRDRRAARVRAGLRRA